MTQVLKIPSREKLATCIHSMQLPKLSYTSDAFVDLKHIAHMGITCVLHYHPHLKFEFEIARSESVAAFRGSGPWVRSDKLYFHCALL